MNEALVSKITRYLEDEDNLRWSTSATLIRALQIRNLQPLELDGLLIQYIQENRGCGIRCSTLPSKLNLDVLWGSVHRIKQRDVLGIYKKDEEILIEELNRVGTKNLFLSHSFKDLKAVVELSKKLLNYNIYAWLAETEILKYNHINHSVKKAIEGLPYFGVFITEHLVDSIWSAKEIGFALNNKKEIFGFLNSDNQELIPRIKELSFEGGNAISKDIFRKFFDNQSNVKFLLYPESSNHAELKHIGIDGIIDWSYLKTIG